MKSFHTRAKAAALVCCIALVSSCQASQKKISGKGMIFANDQRCPGQLIITIKQRWFCDSLDWNAGISTVAPFFTKSKIKLTVYDYDSKSNGNMATLDSLGGVKSEHFYDGGFLQPHHSFSMTDALMIASAVNSGLDTVAAQRASNQAQQQAAIQAQQQTQQNQVRLAQAQQQAVVLAAHPKQCRDISREVTITTEWYPNGSQGFWGPSKLILDVHNRSGIHAFCEWKYQSTSGWSAGADNYAAGADLRFGVDGGNATSDRFKYLCFAYDDFVQNACLTEDANLRNLH